MVSGGFWLLEGYCFLAVVVFVETRSWSPHFACSGFLLDSQMTLHSVALADTLVELLDPVSQSFLQDSLISSLTVVSLSGGEGGSSLTSVGDKLFMWSTCLFHN